jgi:catechol 2,3-dioxygenase-like lactoylglutathione lyase family enzyme
MTTRPAAVIDRITLIVSDLDRAEEDYIRTFGGSVEQRGDIDPALVRVLCIRQARGRRSLLRLGRERIELLEFTDSAGRPYPPGSTSTDIWFQHLAIVVTDMRDAYQQVMANRRFRPISRDGPVRLPDHSGGVTAFKFRDHDGHPLELLAFPEGRVPGQWRAANGTGTFLGVDHTAIAVSDPARSVKFFGSVFGFGTGTRTENRGPEQADLDDVDHVHVSVTRLAPDLPAPRLELLHYHVGTRRPIPHDTASNDIAATHSVIQVASLDATTAALARHGTPLADDDLMILPGGVRAALVSGPDGHRFLAEERAVTGLCRGLPAHVAHQPGDVLGDQPADRPAGVDADHDLARRVEDEAGGLQVHRVRINEGTGQPGDRSRVGTEPDGKGQAVLGDEGGGGGFVIDRQGDDTDASVGQGGTGPLEGAQLGVAVGTPRAAVEQHHAEPAGERLRHRDGRAARDSKHQFRESVTGVQQGHRQAPHRYRVGQVPGGDLWGIGDMPFTGAWPHGGIRPRKARHASAGRVRCPCRSASSCRGSHRAGNRPVRDRPHPAGATARTRPQPSSRPGRVHDLASCPGDQDPGLMVDEAGHPVVPPGERDEAVRDQEGDQRDRAGGERRRRSGHGPADDRADFGLAACTA